MLTFTYQGVQIPNAPCREYLPTFPLECGHFSPNVGKYSLHGASGDYGKFPGKDSSLEPKSAFKACYLPGTNILLVV